MSASSGAAMSRDQGSGINPDDGGMVTFATMKKHRPDFLLHSDDTIYADGVTPSEVKLPDGKIWKNVTIPEKAEIAETLDEFRAAHSYNFLDENVRAFDAEVPMFVQWDPHEVMNNWSSSKEIPARRQGARYCVARRALHETYPMRESLNEPGRSIAPSGRISTSSCWTNASYRGPNGPNLQTIYGPTAISSAPVRPRGCSADY